MRRRMSSPLGPSRGEHLASPEPAMFNDYSLSASDELHSGSGVGTARGCNRCIRAFGTGSGKRLAVLRLSGENGRPMSNIRCDNWYGRRGLTSLGRLSQTYTSRSDCGFFIDRCHCTGGTHGRPHIVFRRVSRCFVWGLTRIVGSFFCRGVVMASVAAICDG